jgi:hypothetical protein
MALKRSSDFQFRFTFVSDTGQANLDGWMIDDFTFDTDNINCSGISDENFENLVVLSPNPTNDFINISTDETLKNNELSISFFDLLGNKLKEEKLYNKNNSLDISHWQNGFYFYQIKQKEQIIKSGKLIKE